MRRQRALSVVAVAVVVVATATPMSSAAEGCQHPYPCGDEWPAGLEGPFEVASLTNVTVPSHDGVLLDGYVAVPALPEGVRAPAVLLSSPYLGTCSADPLAGPGCAPPPEEQLRRSDPAAVGLGDIVAAGYAVALFAVRGTGGSGGCFEFAGPREQEDQGVLVEWLASRPWSNGRVGVIGLSYESMTALEAAVQAPPSLKTIVVAGILSDPYTVWSTPQGATQFLTAVNDPQYTAGVSLLPPLNGNAGAYGERLWERACSDVAETMTTNGSGMAADTRDAAFYDDRRLIDRFPEVTSSVLLLHGFGDFGVAFQESAVWHALTQAPKRQVEGPWGHTMPVPGTASFDPTWEDATWSEMLFAWLDYWLKGVGPVPEHLGRVDYQVRDTWRSSAAWPPVEARDEVLYLSGEGLDPQPGTGARSFRSVRSPTDSFVTARSFGAPYMPWWSLCPPAHPVADPSGLVYLSEPLATRAVLAGNPFLMLRITSDQPGGILHADAFYLGPDFSCGPDGQPRGTIRIPSTGAADLRFHAGNFAAANFPVGEPTDLRIDLWDLARELDPGSRIGVFLQFGELPFEYAGRPYAPRITVHADASHVVLPFVEGTLGGGEPTRAYPPRPFVP